MKYLLIYNPHSGPRKDNEKLLRDVQKRLEQEGHSVEARETEAENHARKIASEALNSDVDVVVAIGGDGTVNEIGHALKGSDKILGIIPNGSGNGLARELNIPMNGSQATQTLLRHDVVEIDTCTANNDPFFVTCGMGFDGSVSEEFATSDTRGAVSYVREVLELFVNYKAKDYLVAIDGKEVTATAFLVTVANASQYGNNAFIAPNASMSDGILDITVIKEFPMVKAPQIALQLLSKEINKNAYTDTYQGRTITITSNSEVPYHVDGEPKGDTNRLEIRVSPKRLKVIQGREEDREKTIFDFFKSISGAFDHAFS